MSTPNWQSRHLEVAAQCWKAPFRGEIWDYARRVWLGSSYVVPDAHVCNPCKARGIAHCRHFEIDTCRQLVGPLRAMRDPNVELVMVLKAAQTLGSLSWDMAVHYFLAVSPYMTIAVFLENDQKALSYADKRLMPTLRANPDIAPLLPTGIDRFDASKREIKFTNGKIIAVMGLNETNASSLSWEVVIIDEGWQHGADGLMLKAVDRAKQVARRKIIIVGQAGDETGDQHQFFWSKCSQVPLTYACPECGHRQAFALNKARPGDFDAGTPELTQRLNADPWYGLKVLERFSDLTTPEAIQEAARGSFVECYQCGYRIRDTREGRAALMATYRQDYQPAGYTPKASWVGFWIPDAASVTIPFAQTMTAYIAAKKANDELGNSTPLHDFYINRWATAWHQGIISVTVPVVTGSYDISNAIPDEVCRVMAVDCQQDDALTAATGKSTMGHYWYIARAIDKYGNTYQLSRGYATSHQQWQEVQRRLQISNENVGIDGGNWRQEVIRLAAENIEQVQKRVRRHGRWAVQPMLFTWTVLVGSGKRNSWKWPDGHHRSISTMQPQGQRITWQGRQLEIRVPLYEWSNLSIKDQLAELVRGGAGRVKFLSLGRDKIEEATRLREVGNLTYENQMAAEYRTTKKTGVPYWEKQRADNHYLDCECMCLAMFGLGGFLGVAAAPEAAGNAAE